MSQQRADPRNPGPTGRPLTRRQLSRRERERRRQRIAIAAISGALLVSLLILAVPLLKQAVWDPSRTVAVVAGQRITRSDYDKYQRLTALGLTQPEVLNYYYSAYQRSEEDFRSQLEQTLGQQPAGTTGPDAATLDPLVDGLVLAASAEEAGIELTDGQVKAKVLEYAGPPTPEGPAATPTRQPAASGTTQPTVAVSPTIALPTEEKLNAFFGVLQDVTGIGRADYERLSVRPALARDAYVEKHVPEVAEQVHVRHILVATKAEAEHVLKDLKAGRNFEELARERSTDEQNKLKGGDLGWAPRGIYAEPFEEAAFALEEPGQLSQPVKTQFGWHVIQLLERDKARELTEEQRGQVGARKVDEFVKSQRKRLSEAGQLTLSIPPTPTPAPTPAVVPTVPP